MLASYKKAGNIALGASVVCFAAIVILGKGSTTGNVWEPGGAPPILMYGTVFAILIAFWAYAKAKGHSGWLGVILPFLNIIGLVVLLKLKDKHPDNIEPNVTTKQDLNRKWATVVFVIVGMAAMAYVFMQIQKIAG
jgi:hypothetical protein